MSHYKQVRETRKYDALHCLHRGISRHIQQEESKKNNQETAIKSSTLTASGFILYHSALQHSNRRKCTTPSKSTRFISHTDLDYPNIPHMSGKRYHIENKAPKVHLRQNHDHILPNAIKSSWLPQNVCHNRRPSPSHSPSPSPSPSISTASLPVPMFSLPVMLARPNSSSPLTTPRQSL